MIRRTAALMCLTVVTAWHAWVEQQDQVLIPYDHPANPEARAAPPIRVPRIQGPNIQEVIPDPARQEAKPSTSRPGAPMHQHQH